jgi:hypothetical protein
MENETKLPIETIVNIVNELIRLTKTGKIGWTIERANNDGKKWHEWTSTKLSTTVNNTLYKMYTGVGGGYFYMNDRKILSRDITENPNEFHNYLRSLNCNPFNQLEAAIEQKPFIDIVEINTLLDGLKTL